MGHVYISTQTPFPFPVVISRPKPGALKGCVASTKASGVQSPKSPLENFINEIHPIYCLNLVYKSL